jgi:hypothetical protein
VLPWAQLGLHKKPCGILNISGFFNPLLDFLDRAVEQGFIRREHRDMLLVSDEPEELLAGFESYVAPTVEKWVELKARTYPASGADRLQWGLVCREGYHVYHCPTARRLIIALAVGEEYDHNRDLR